MRDRRRGPMPTARDTPASGAGRCAVAIFEAAKRLLVLLLGLGLLDLMHQDVEAMAERLLLDLHIGPDRRLARVVLDATSKLTDARLWALAGTAGPTRVCALRRLGVCGSGGRGAQWFAMLSGTLYLPWEAFKVAQRANWFHTGVFAGNVIILLYMAYLLIGASRRRASEGQ